MCKTVNDLDAVGSSNTVAFHEKQFRHESCKETSAAAIKGLIAYFKLNTCLNTLVRTPGGNTSFRKVRGGGQSCAPKTVLSFQLCTGVLKCMLEDVQLLRPQCEPLFLQYWENCTDVLGEHVTATVDTGIGSHRAGVSNFIFYEPQI